METLLTQDECARYLRTSRWTLARWRTTGKGPKWILKGRRVMYRQASVETWLRSNEYTSQAEATTSGSRPLRRKRKHVVPG